MRTNTPIPACCVALLAALSLTATADEIVCFEAEACLTNTAPVAIAKYTGAAPASAWAPVKGASQDTCIEIPQGSGNPPEVTKGSASWTFEVKEGGTYIVWCRVWWIDECGNSFGLSVDGAKAFSFGQDATYKRWHWVKSPPRLAQLKLKKGKHTLKLTNREDGIRLDQIFITNERDNVPVDIEPTTAK